MSSRIRTSRCELRSVRPNDREDVVELYGDPAVRRFLGGPVAAEQIRREFHNRVAPGATRQWAIRCKQTQAFIGLVYLGPHHDGCHQEISYQLLPAWWGKGYAREAVGAIIDYAFNELALPRIVAETQSANIASCRLLEELGMQVERTTERFGAQQAIYSKLAPCRPLHRNRRAPQNRETQ